MTDKESLQQTLIVPGSEEPLHMRHGRKAYFAATMQLVLAIQGTKQVFRCQPQRYLLMGRGQLASALPYLDLAAFTTDQDGVSRRHARLIRTNATLMIEDLAARNGTFLNNQRLASGQPQVICNGDEIRLGRLTFLVKFEEAGVGAI